MKIIFLTFFIAQFVSGHNEKGQRIIGGQIARVGQFPFATAIYKSTPNGQYFCGGGLFTNQWIITAGQCVDGATLFNIYLGTNNIQSPDPSTSVRLATDEYVLHKEFNPLTLEHDLGLIKLRLPIEFTMYIQQMRLPTNELPGNAGALQAIGWGQISDSTPRIEDELNFVDITTLTNEECRITYGNQITDTMVCIVGSYNEGACTGDSGSPLVQWIRGVYPVHVGVSSFVSANGCESTDPSGYTRTYPYNNWINNITTAL